MKKMIAGSMVLACVAVLAACGKEAKTAVAGGTPCESLEPALAALPTEEKIGGAPLTYRGCNTADGEGNVAVIYATPEQTPSFSYNVVLINENSPYGKSFLDSELSKTAGVDIFALRTGLRRDIFERRIRECREAIAGTAEPKPMMFEVEGLEICAAGLQQDGRRKMQAFGIQGDFGYEMIIDTPEIERLSTMAEANRLITDYFSKFNLQALQ
jgi:hypothetical protein